MPAPIQTAAIILAVAALSVMPHALVYALCAMGWVPSWFVALVFTAMWLLFARLTCTHASPLKVSLKKEGGVGLVMRGQLLRLSLSYACFGASVIFMALLSYSVFIAASLIYVFYSYSYQTHYALTHWLYPGAAIGALSAVLLYAVSYCRTTRQQQRSLGGGRHRHHGEEGDAFNKMGSTSTGDHDCHQNHYGDSHVRITPIDMYGAHIETHDGRKGVTPRRFFYAAPLAIGIGPHNKWPFLLCLLSVLNISTAMLYITVVYRELVDLAERTAFLLPRGGSEHLNNNWNLDSLDPYLVLRVHCVLRRVLRMPPPTLLVSSTTLRVVYVYTHFGTLCLLASLLYTLWRLRRTYIFFNGHTAATTTGFAI